jgi:hypothetical protein
MSSEIINLNNTTPAAPENTVNVAWQKGASSGTDPASGVPIYPVSANVPAATASTLGVVQPDGVTVDVNGAGVISVPTATTSALGLVKPDGTTITIASGIISAAATPLPSGSANEVLATPNGASGAASLRALVPADLPVATTSALGAVKPDGSTITISGGVISAVAGGGGTSMYFGQGFATAGSGSTTITLGSTPVSNSSVSIYVNGSILTPNAYSISGTTITLSSALSAGDVAVVNWVTTNATPGGISFGLNPAIRGTLMQASSASSYTVSWPTGTQAGDLAVICVGHGWVAMTPSGWTSQNAINGTNWNGAVFSKVLTSADITAGSVDVPFSGNYDGILAITTFIGSTAGIREADFSQNRSGSGSVVAPSTSSSVLSSDTALYFGSNRAASTCSVNLGTVQGTANDGGNASGCVYAEALTSSGAVQPTMTYSANEGLSGGNYQGTVIVKGV